jgi:basic membrane lipoprotein Med (substrate-binding protein (PBP1-ABC) superfamily)
VAGIVLVLFAGAVVIGCGDDSSDSGGGSDSGGDALKIAFVYNAPANDQGWNQAWDVAREEIVAKYGDKIEVTFKENVPDGPQSGLVMRQLVQDGNEVIVSTSFGYQEAALAVANEFPKVTFLQVTALKTAPNLSGFDYNGTEGFYVAGMASAAAAKSDTLGFVGAYPIPSNLAYLNSFALGARAINPNATVKVLWTNDWVDTTKAQNAAQALVNSGATALAHITSGPGPAPVAKSTNTVWTGFEVDQSARAPEQYVTGFELHWAAYLEREIDAIMDGSWKTGFFYAGMREGVVSADNWGPAFDTVSDDDRAKVEGAVEELKAGSLKIFEGPIKDQSGAIKVPAGKELTVAEIQATDYLVEGVAGRIPTGG